MATTQTFTYETDSLPLLQETLENMLPVLYGRTGRFYLSRNKHGFNEARILYRTHAHGLTATPPP